MMTFGPTSQVRDSQHSRKAKKVRLVGSQNVLYKLLCKVVDMTLKPHIVRAAAPQHLALLPSGITISGVLARCWEE